MKKRKRNAKRIRERKNMKRDKEESSTRDNSKSRRRVGQGKASKDV